MPKRNLTPKQLETIQKLQKQINARRNSVTPAMLKSHEVPLKRKTKKTKGKFQGTFGYSNGINYGVSPQRAKNISAMIYDRPDYRDYKVDADGTRTKRPVDLCRGTWVADDVQITRLGQLQQLRNGAIAPLTTGYLRR